ncbi:hypothetical protein B0H17DRAFT_1046713 [Mycena rosella]|uniref:DUF6534 domain-containing protein n=1 Tax=Mycena rosella TaxID=1033263 RepID=A0AAD7GQT2_MYCRO|nr:hypothetical protein B0H17DRAFT_1046713 [Mycena rosella]
MSNATSPFLTPDRLTSLAVGSWVNMVLFTLECMQAVQYFRSQTRRTDSAFTKLGVSVNLGADVAGTAACCATTYLYLVTDWGIVEALETQHWTLTGVTFTVGVVTAVSQFFMISRYWQMTRRHVVFSLLLLLLIGALTGIFGTGVLMALSPNAKGVLLDAFLLLSLIASSAGNALVSLLSFWQRCKRNDAQAAKWYLPHRILAALIETGTVTTAVTVAGAVVTLGSVRDTRIWIAFAFIQARVYSCTMLFVLLGRPESASAGKAKAAEAALASSEKQAAAGAMVPPASLMDDADAFRLTRKRIELHDHEYDSADSDVSRNLNNELRDMGRSPRPSWSSDGSEARGRHPAVLSRSVSESPSEYPMSPSPEPELGLRSPSPDIELQGPQGYPHAYPISPMNLSPRSGSPV